MVSVVRVQSNDDEFTVFNYAVYSKFFRHFVMDYLLPVIFIVFICML